MIFNRVTILLAVLAVSSCTNSLNSVEKNAHNAVSQIEKLHFDPNTRPITADNIRLTSNFLHQFYALGKQDREAGVSLEKAQKRVESFSRNTDANKSDVDDLLGEPLKGPFTEEAQKSMFLNQEYSAEQPNKQRKILLDSAIKTYWDGYYGHI